jgi:hypothetical protein
LVEDAGCIGLPLDEIASPEKPASPDISERAYDI